MFDLNTSILDPEYDEELDEGRLEKYINGLMSEFEESSEAKAFMDEFDTSLGWPATYMHYAVQYFCATPATVTPEETAEILFEIFPRKVSVEADFAYEIIAELRAFWQFLRRTRSLAKSDTILELLTDDDADRLEAELADPSNFGMAKSIFTIGKNAGFDITDQDDLNRIKFAYNALLSIGTDIPPDLDDDNDDFTEPIRTAVLPIRNAKRHIGRNETCSCESGRKYKKCCGQ
jgi:hypothetical protein